MRREGNIMPKNSDDIRLQIATMRDIATDIDNMFDDNRRNSLAKVIGLLQNQLHAQLIKERNDEPAP